MSQQQPGAVTDIAPYHGAPLSWFYSNAERVPAPLLMLITVVLGVGYAFALEIPWAKELVAPITTLGLGLTTSFCAAGVFRRPKTAAKGFAVVCVFCFLALAGKWGTQYLMDARDPVTTAEVQADLGSSFDSPGTIIVSTDDGYFTWVRNRALLGFEVEDCGSRCTRWVERRWGSSIGRPYFFQANVMWLLWTLEAAFIYAWCHISLVGADPRKRHRQRR